MTDCFTMTAAELRLQIRTGGLTAEQTVRSFLDRIAALDDAVGAWSYIDPAYALSQARDADRAQASGQPVGALHGVPVGIKDIFDTIDMPTEYGTVLHAGNQPCRDATAVSLLRQAGAIIIGKTVTTELAIAQAGITKNPHDLNRTPGGSSSGSAAAVASMMVPVALGTQTNGSIIRPASFCGVVGYKPSYGLISRHGCLKQSGLLDQVGVFGRTVEDAAVLAQELMSYDSKDPDMAVRARLRLVECVNSRPPSPPRFAYVKSPVWGEAQDHTRAAFEGLVAKLGGQVDEVLLPGLFDTAVEDHGTIMESDVAVSLAGQYARGAELLSPAARGMIERGRERRATDYIRARQNIPKLIAALGDVVSGYDAILTPAAIGEAPIGYNPTGNPVFCTIWSLCGLPAISIPILKGVTGLPLGTQLVGLRNDDARLLRTARWLVESVGTAFSQLGGVIGPKVTPSCDRAPPALP